MTHHDAALLRAEKALSGMDTLIVHGRATDADRDALRAEVAMRRRVMDAMREGTDHTLRGEAAVWREYMLAHALYEMRWESGEWDEAQFHAAARELLRWRDETMRRYRRAA